MPTYQYACTDCGHAFEQFQSFSDDALTVCPECAGRLRKVFNAVGVVFKGSGFYRTDSRNGSKGGDGADSGGADSRSADKKPGADTKSPDKEPARTKSAGSNNPGNAKQPISSGSSSTGTKASSS